MTGWLIDIIASGTVKHKRLLDGGLTHISAACCDEQTCRHRTCESDTACVHESVYKLAQNHNQACLFRSPVQNIPILYNSVLDYLSGCVPACLYTENYDRRRGNRSGQSQAVTSLSKFIDVHCRCCTPSWTEMGLSPFYLTENSLLKCVCMSGWAVKHDCAPRQDIHLWLGWATLLDCY